MVTGTGMDTTWPRLRLRPRMYTQRLPIPVPDTVGSLVTGIQWARDTFGTLAIGPDRRMRALGGLLRATTGTVTTTDTGAAN